MSDIEAYVGRLIPVKLEEGQALDDWIQKELGVDELVFEESWVEELQAERYKEFHYDYSTGILYEIEKEKLGDHFMQMTKNSDGSFDFSTSFYNGGTNLNEMLQEGIDEI